MDKNFVSKFLKGSASASSGTIATVIFHFFSITLMTRYVSQEALGLYFLILATAMFFKILSNFGMDLTLVKFLSSEDRDEKQETMTVILITRAVILLITSLIVYFGSGLILPLLGEGLEPYVLLIPLIFVGHSVRELLLHLMQGLQQFKNYALVQFVSAIFKFLLILVLSQQLSLFNLLYIELAMLGMSIIMQIAMIPFRKLGFFEMKLSRSMLKQVMTFGFPLYYTSILTIGYDKSSVFLINYFLDPLSIALYSVALKLPEGFMRIFRSFITVYFPSVSALFAQGKNREAVKVMSKSIGLLSLLVSTLCVGAFLFGREIVTILFSEQYSSVDLAMGVLLVGVYLRLIANLLGYSLVSAGYPSTSSKVNTVSVVVYLSSSIFLIPRTGYIGAALAVLVMNSVAIGCYYWYLARANIAPSLVPFLQPTLLATAVVGTFLLVGSESLLVKISLMGLFIALCAIFVPDFKQAVQFGKDLFQKMGSRFGWQTKPV